MLFNSLNFLIFFPTVTLLYFLLPHKFRWFLLLAASCFFYMAFIPVYILILAITIGIDYFAGMWIEDSQGSKKKIYLVVSIISTCLVLFIFKYFNFFNANFAALAGFLHLNYPIGMVNIILPIGLSFHTFQSLSYVIEVYRGHHKAERHFGIYSLYVMFYPQLVAGPIERPGNLLHQFREEHYFDYKRVTDGLKLMAWGLFKKVVISDRLAIVVNNVYGNPEQYNGLTLIIGTVFFAFQIYCDFSGYSDIAIGAAQVMGFKLMDNFNRPYYSKSIAEFWKRWHISLSTWFRDYLYISLGGNRVPKWRWYYNLFITFTISGLWHGANWTYVIWGMLNGFYLILEIWTEKIRAMFEKTAGLVKFPRLHKLYRVLITFGLTCFAWIFFRANSLDDAVYIITHMFSGPDYGYAINIFKSTSYHDLLQNLYNFKLYIERLGLTRGEFMIAVFSIFFLEFVHLIQRHGQIRHMLSNKPVAVRWAVYLVILLAIANLSVGQKVPFIYFQF